MAIWWKTWKRQVSNFEATWDITLDTTITDYDFKLLAGVKQVKSFSFAPE